MAKIFKYFLVGLFVWIFIGIIVFPVKIFAELVLIPGRLLTHNLFFQIGISGAITIVLGKLILSKRFKTALKSKESFIPGWLKVIVNIFVNLIPKDIDKLHIILKTLPVVLWEAEGAGRYRMGALMQKEVEGWPGLSWVTELSTNLPYVSNPRLIETERLVPLNKTVGQILPELVRCGLKGNDFTESE